MVPYCGRRSASFREVDDADPSAAALDFPAEERAEMSAERIIGGSVAIVSTNGP